MSRNSTIHSYLEFDMINKHLLSVDDFVKEVPVKAPTVRSWIATGKLPIIRLGRLIFIHRKTVDLILREGLKAVSELKSE
jgi:excisionase family DNA binding protein